MSLPVSPQLDFSEIPLIDIAPLIKGSDTSKTVLQLRHACEHVGFFYVKNHGVNRSLIASLHAQAQLFFAQPSDVKMHLLVNQQMRGYLPLDYQSYVGEQRAATSRQEGFWIGHNTPYSADRPLDGPNRWPEHLPQFQLAMESYFTAVEALSRVLIRGFAHALEIAPDMLIPLFENPTTRLKLNHYPPQENPDNEKHIGVVPHADSGAFTILWQDHHGGLEVLNKSDSWVGAPPIEDTFVVNLGNIMPIWSNGRFASTKHRVINRGSNDRYSIPLFVNPDQSVFINNLMPGTSTNEPPFVYGEYQSKFWQQAFPIAHAR